MPTPDTAVTNCFPVKDVNGNIEESAEILFNRIDYQVQRRIEIPSRGPPGRQQYKS